MNDSTRDEYETYPPEIIHKTLIGKWMIRAIFLWIALGMVFLPTVEQFGIILVVILIPTILLIRNDWRKYAQWRNEQS